ncbi:hypothetical protein [Planococcus shixiaomingii]|uniref:hypothetical protein n=1 Tax=Planococcus shixiaomingii TaxID=3058393 RepID=UPI00261C7C8A|nr:hypothetical protein [Planococcus sp. N022]WKA53440.1 hypothetical protein QWY21_12295 [Planococcus sp. N022]
MASIQEKLNNFLNKQYNEEEMVLFLESQKYTEIDSAEVTLPKQLKHITKLKRFKMKFFKEFRTLFVGVNSEGNIAYTRMENKDIDDHPSFYADLGLILGCLIPIVAIVGLVIWFATVVVGGVVENWNSYDEDDTYEYISDDKDSDGDVDYDDVEKYLNDSLEEDVNDGDDW